MNSTLNSLSDSEFLMQFENKTLAPEHFNHVGHMRLAWLYLTTQDFNLKKSVEPRIIAQGLDSSGYLKKPLITGKVTTQFFNTPLKSISCTLISHPTDFFRLKQAIASTCSGIEAYAISLGASNKFHLTITIALLLIMAKRIEAMNEKNWELFLEQNQDLVNNAMSVLNEYYSSEKLLSNEARVSFIEPDLKPI